MLNFGASKPRVGGARAPGPPLDPHLGHEHVIFANFSQKLHEIEKIWTPGGGAYKILLCRSATDFYPSSTPPTPMAQNFLNFVLLSKSGKFAGVGGCGRQSRNPVSIPIILQLWAVKIYGHRTLADVCVCGGGGGSKREPGHL